jgi:hypothetical protein
MSGLAKLTLWGAGLMMLVVGALHLFNPQMMMDTPQIQLSTVNHLHVVRAAYGGAYLGIAVFFLMGALGRIPTRAALLSVLVLFGGFALGRLVSLLVDGMPVGLYLGVLSTEVFFAVCAALALRSLRQHD